MLYVVSIQASNDPRGAELIVAAVDQADAEKVATDHARSTLRLRNVRAGRPRPIRTMNA